VRARRRNETLTHARKEFIAEQRTQTLQRMTYRRLAQEQSLRRSGGGALAHEHREDHEQI
jgi:hypothetical protein